MPVHNVVSGCKQCYPFPGTRTNHTHTSDLIGVQHKLGIDFSCVARIGDSVICVVVVVVGVAIRISEYIKRSPFIVSINL